MHTHVLRKFKDYVSCSMISTVICNNHQEENARAQQRRQRARNVHGAGHASWPERVYNASLLPPHGQAFFNKAAFAKWPSHFRPGVTRQCAWFKETWIHNRTDRSLVLNDSWSVFQCKLCQQLRNSSTDAETFGDAHYHDIKNSQSCCTFMTINLNKIIIQGWRMKM